MLTKSITDDKIENALHKYKKGFLNFMMDNRLEIGKIVNTHGLRGEVKIVPWTNTPDVFEDIEYLYINGREEKKHEILNIKYQKNNIIVKLKGLDDINEAEGYKNCVVTTDREQLGELDEGEYFITDLIGCVAGSEDGTVYGKLIDVINTGSNDIYVVKRQGMRDLLIPVIDDVVLDIDIDTKKITVRLMEGLEDL